MTALDEFHQTTTKPTRCLTCALPDHILEVIEENEARPLARRHSRIKVVEWVESEGYTTSRDSLYSHFSQKHANRDKGTSIVHA